MIKLKFLLDNKNNFKNVIEKHNKTLKNIIKINKKTSLIIDSSMSAIYTITLYSLTSNADFSVFSLCYYMIYLALILNIIFSEETNTDFSFYKLLKKMAFSTFFKRNNNYLFDFIYNKFGFVNKKSKKIINDFYNKLNKSENNTYNQISNNKNNYHKSGDMKDYHFIIYQTLTTYLQESNIEEIEYNKNIIFSLIDELNETSIIEQEIIQLYLSETIKDSKINGKYKNKTLNKLNTIEDASQINIIKSKKIKQL
jgi:hypothetical protein